MNHPPTPFDEHARAIGYVCQSWAILELLVNRYIELLVPLPEGPEAECITVNADMRQKIQMLRGLGFIKRTSDEWYEKLRNQLNILDDELRPERNRFIHDIWLPILPLEASVDQFIRRTYKMTVRKKPPQAEMELTTRDEKLLSAEDAWAFHGRMATAMIRLVELLNEWGAEFEHPETPSPDK